MAPVPDAFGGAGPIRPDLGHGVAAFFDAGGLGGAA